MWWTPRWAVLEKRVVLDERVSVDVGVSVSIVSCQVHANVVVEELEAGKQRDFTSGYELYLNQACLSDHFFLLPRCYSSFAYRLCSCERRWSGVS